MAVETKPTTAATEAADNHQSLSKYKARLDRKMLALLRQQAEAAGEDPNQVELKPWQARDLRRTSRTCQRAAESPQYWARNFPQ